MVSKKCRKCGSTNIISERRINGNSECLDCGNKSSTRDFMHYEEIEEGVVVGDSGGSAENIASGNLSGNFVIANKISSYVKKSKKKDKENRKNKKRNDKGTKD